VFVFFVLHSSESHNVTLCITADIMFFMVKLPFSHVKSWWFWP